MEKQCANSIIHNNLNGFSGSKQSQVKKHEETIQSWKNRSTKMKANIIEKNSKLKVFTRTVLSLILNSTSPIILGNTHISEIAR